MEVTSVAPAHETHAAPARSDRPQREPSWVPAVRGWLVRGPLGRPVVRVLTFTGFLGLLALVGLVLVAPDLPSTAPPFLIPWPVLALLFASAEMFDVQVHFRRETHAFSLSEVPLVVALFFLGPMEFMAAYLFGSGAALLWQSREHPLKVVFNLANYAFTGLVALTVFHALVPMSPQIGPAHWVAAFVAALGASVLAATTIATAISLSGGAPQFQKLPEMIQFGALVALANTSLSLLAVTVLQADAQSIWLLAIPIATLLTAYKAYVSEREKHERLELLYESSRILHNSPELDSAIVALLDHAREMFRAEIAEIVLYARGDDTAALVTRSYHELPPEAMQPVTVPTTDMVRERVSVSTRPFFHGPTDQWRRQPIAIRQAMTSRLAGENGLIGEITVANRLTEGTRFQADDLRLLEMVANQAAIALENGRLEQSLTELSNLKEQLRHQAYHDSLTGLPNRAMFVERIDARLADGHRPEETIPAVLFLDLDDFKVVNDTLGHQAGDRLLVGVAERIETCIRTGDLAARLGGDEFAVLLEDAPGLERAFMVAQRILDVLRAPFVIDEMELVVGGSVGIAVPRDAADRGADLLRHADMAMYTAKAEGKRRVAVFDPMVHSAIVARHELSRELARSIDHGELLVHYQPILNLHNGALLGIEALVRWRHPTRGLVGPDEFIRLAEDTGGIVDLGRWVMAESCRQAVRWTQLGLLAKSSYMSVNISALQVRLDGFVEDTLGIALTAGLDPGRLVLELTETAMFGDVQGTIASLEALRRHGVRIALDDFGTGYSSLGYLRRFPVDILKIARDFIVDGRGNAEDWAFAHAIVALGRSLSLAIVAEGIEDADQQARLLALGCDLGQGYLLCRPMDDLALEAWLRVRLPTAPRPATITPSHTVQVTL